MGEGGGGENFLYTYVYFKIPSNLFVQIMTHLSAPPDANLLPAIIF